MNKEWRIIHVVKEGGEEVLKNKGVLKSIFTDLGRNSDDLISLGIDLVESTDEEEN